MGKWCNLMILHGYYTAATGNALIRKVKQAKNFQVPNPDQPKIQPTVPRHKDYISQKLNEKSSTTI